MNCFLNILTKLTDVLLLPFRNLPPFWGIAFLSLITAVFILLTYKALSNQEAITRFKKRVFGNFFGIYLFRDDLALILRSLGKVFTSIFKYLSYSFPPLLGAIIPILLLCAQMQVRYGYRPFRPGDEVNVSLQLAPEIDVIHASAELLPSPGIEVMTPPLRIRDRNEADWRIRITAEGVHQLTFRVEGVEVSKTVRAVSEIGRIYPARERASFLSALKYPGEEPLPESDPVLSIAVDYPTATVGVLGFSIHWVILYFALAMVFGFALKRPLKVDF